MSLLLEKFHELENLLKQEKRTLSDVAKSISSIIGSNVYLIDSEGSILANALPHGNDCLDKPPADDGLLVLKPEFKQRMGFVFQTAANLPLESSFLNGSDSFQPNTFMTIAPIRNLKNVIGHLLLTKQNQPFNEEELALTATAAMVTCIYFYNSDSAKNEADSKNSIASVELVLDSLSFSEMKAITNVFKDLNGPEGFLVASKIADRIGISRSVIVNAMRKLESAGVVDSRSLGIKGTYIKVKNLHFLEALKTKIK